MTSIDTVRWATDLLLTEHNPRVVEENLEDQLTQAEDRESKERIQIALQYLDDLRNKPNTVDLLADGSGTQINQNEELGRITVRLPDTQHARLERLVQSGEYTSVAEAVRDAIRHHKPFTTGLNARSQEDK